MTSDSGPLTPLTLVLQVVSLDCLLPESLSLLYLTSYCFKRAFLAGQW